jgi:acyl-coenzyme A synthetase/AMP-(fatty) acid ligase
VSSTTAVNCVQTFKNRAREAPGRMAIQMPRSKPVSFAELLNMGSKAQAHFLKLGLRAGDSVLLLDRLSPRLYAQIIGILATGATAVLVEPWMEIERINHAIRLVKPKIFAAGTMGRVWGMRLKSVREIPHWVHPRSWMGDSQKELVLESVPGDMPGILTFTSGTTGAPKGVVRQQGYMMHQHRILTQALDLEAHTRPDLCIFANFALANLASGRGSIIVPPKWSDADLKWLTELPYEDQPESLTTGPAFLLKLMAAQKQAKLSGLKSIHVGGALTDCWIFEKAFEAHPDAHFMHIYGSSEAEPVAIADAREAVKESRAKGFFQTLYLGQPIVDIEAKIESDNLWVTGPHVCPLYLGGEEENRVHKRRDEKGRVWHSMGDRVRVEDGKWWYSGRSQQPFEHFEIEQKAYAALGSSKAFVLSEPEGVSLCIEPSSQMGHEEILEKLRGLKAVQRFYEVEIKRDARHRARIDRVKSAKTRRAWRIG